MCFTTGRGSVFGCKPAPSLKLVINTAMFRHMEQRMDINCGTVPDGDEIVSACEERVFRHMLATASGTPTKSETLGFGDAQFAPWVLGATM
jgi:altronate hydrolase